MCTKIILNGEFFSKNYKKIDHRSCQQPTLAINVTKFENPAGSRQCLQATQASQVVRITIES